MINSILNFIQVDSVVVVKNTTSADDVMEEFNEVFENISDEKLEKMLKKQITVVPSARKLVSNCETILEARENLATNSSFHMRTRYFPSLRSLEGSLWIFF